MCDTNDFKFIKVEDFFNQSKEWTKLTRVISPDYDDKLKVLFLNFQNDTNDNCLLVIHFPKKDTFRFRFNPSKANTEDYSNSNTRSIVMDSFDELINNLPDFTLQYNFNKQTNIAELTTFEQKDKPYMKMVIELDNFEMTVYKYNDINEEILVLSTDDYGTRFNKRCSYDGIDEYSIVQSFVKPFTAKYIGFGETGGKTLCKNGSQLTYMNYDNMKYEQIYKRGPLDDREALYHTNPFFMEFYGVPSEDIVCGLFIDNVSESFVDVGYSNSERYMIGTLLGDLDFYFFLGCNAEDIMSSYVSFVGTARLKPRYVLGYHQGC